MACIEARGLRKTFGTTVIAFAASGTFPELSPVRHSPRPALVDVHYSDLECTMTDLPQPGSFTIRLAVVRMPSR